MRFPDNSKKNSFNENLKRFFKKNYFSVILLIILIVIVSLIAYYRVKVQMNMGPMWDTYDFLSDCTFISW